MTYFVSPIGTITCMTNAEAAPGSRAASLPWVPSHVTLDWECSFADGLDKASLGLRKPTPVLRIHLACCRKSIPQASQTLTGPTMCFSYNLRDWK
jgi:hypothetical protein